MWRKYKKIFNLIRFLISDFYGGLRGFFSLLSPSIIMKWVKSQEQLFIVLNSVSFRLYLASDTFEAYSISSSGLFTTVADSQHIVFFIPGTWSLIKAVTVYILLQQKDCFPCKYFRNDTFKCKWMINRFQTFIIRESGKSLKKWEKQTSDIVCKQVENLPIFRMSLQNGQWQWLFCGLN